MKSIISFVWGYNLVFQFWAVCACERVEEYIFQNVEYAAGNMFADEKTGKKGSVWAPRTVDTKGNYSIMPIT